MAYPGVSLWHLNAYAATDRMCTMRDYLSPSLFLRSQIYKSAHAYMYLQ